MGKPRISIITITYNAVLWLESTVQSVVGQVDANIEYIIIDGGSNDGTVDIIRKYEPHIAYWVSEPDGGLYDAMNKGLNRATGDYVWFVNAGDRIHAPETVQNICAGLKEELPDVIYGETAIIDGSGTQVAMRRLKAPASLNWKSFKWGMLVSHQSFIAKRTLASAYDPQYRLVADYDWCIRILQKSKQVYNTHMILSDFLEEGLSSKQRKASLKERYSIMNRYYGKVTTFLLHIWFAVRFYFARYVRGRV